MTHSPGHSAGANHVSGGWGGVPVYQEGAGRIRGGYLPVTAVSGNPLLLQIRHVLCIQGGLVYEKNVQDGSVSGML